jgi:hypothetical protein
MNAKAPPGAKVSAGTYYFGTLAGAKAYGAQALAGTQFAASHQVIQYAAGYAVQLHKSGTYLGPGVNPATHLCFFCPNVL